MRRPVPPIYCYLSLYAERVVNLNIYTVRILNLFQECQLLLSSPEGANALTHLARQLLCVDSTVLRRRLIDDEAETVDLGLFRHGATVLTVLVKPLRRDDYLED